VAVAVHDGADAVGELRRGSAHGLFEAAVHRLGFDLVAVLKPRPDPAHLVDATEGIRWLRQVDRRPAHPRPEAAQGQEHAPRQPLA
jgi:hypothetical protein